MNSSLRETRTRPSPAGVMVRTLPPTSAAAVTADRQHLVSLDIFRGMAVAGMILVNNPGNWNGTFESLTHADWNGCTLADLVFPCFVFILGAAMPFAFARRVGGGTALRHLYVRIVRRSVWLIVLGLMLNAVAASPTIL